MNHVIYCTVYAICENLKLIMSRSSSEIEIVFYMWYLWLVLGSKVHYMVVLAKCQLYPDLLVQTVTTTDWSWLGVWKPQNTKWFGSWSESNKLTHWATTTTLLHWQQWGKFIVLRSSNRNTIVYDRNNHCGMQIKACTDKSPMALSLCVFKV